MVISSILLSLYSVIYGSKLKEKAKIDIIESWIPVVIALLYPVLITLRVILFRRMTQKSYGMEFNVYTLFNLAYLLIGIIFAIFGIVIYWPSVEVTWHLIWVGAFAGATNHMALLTLYKGISMGPAGPIIAVTCLSSVFVLIIEAIRIGRVPTIIEILGIIIGTIGAIEFVYPELFDKIIYSFCNK